jgi:hypothetical protein
MPDSRICVACHTPHYAITATDAPLWNHELNAGGHTPYSSGTMVKDNTGSALCLTCHQK